MTPTTRRHALLASGSALISPAPHRKTPFDSRKDRWAKVVAARNLQSN